MIILVAWTVCFVLVQALCTRAFATAQFSNSGDFCYINGLHCTEQDVRSVYYTATWFVLDPSRWAEKMGRDIKPAGLCELHQIGALPHLSGCFIFYVLLQHLTKALLQQVTLSTFVASMPASFHVLWVLERKADGRH